MVVQAGSTIANPPSSLPGERKEQFRSAYNNFFSPSNIIIATRQQAERSVVFFFRANEPRVTKRDSILS